jgi:hypothetical protein
MFQGQKPRASTRFPEVESLETCTVIHQFILQDSVLTQASLSKKMTSCQEKGKRCKREHCEKMC